MIAFSGIHRRSRLGPPAASVALIASVAFHGALIAVGARWLAGIASPGAADTSGTQEISLAEGGVTTRQTLSGDSEAASSPGDVRTSHTPKPDRPDEFARPALAGAPREPRPDTPTTGRGGTPEASRKALHLSDSIDAERLDADPTSLTRMSQLSRLDTAEARRSREDRRATPNPLELTFVTSGAGVRLARLVPSPTDPAVGAHGAVPVLAPGTAEPSAGAAGQDGWLAPSLPSPRGAEPRTALGVDHGSRRDDFRRTANVALARPAVKQGRASVSTTARGRPNDTLDSAQEVASAVQSLITASSAGGPEGRGPGGSAGDPSPGSAGIAGPGSRARPSGEGGPEESASVLGLSNYTAALTRKVYPYWEDALPLWARVEGRGGVAVIGVTIGESGNVREVHLVRGSGIPEFDRKVATALERASPYGPLPRAVRDGSLQLHIAFDAMNPAVGRAGPGPGRR